MFDRYTIFWYFCLVLVFSLVVLVTSTLYLLYSDFKEYKSLEKEKEKCYNKANKD